MVGSRQLAILDALRFGEALQSGNDIFKARCLNRAVAHSRSKYQRSIPAVVHIYETATRLRAKRRVEFPSPSASIARRATHCPCHRLGDYNPTQIHDHSLHSTMPMLIDVAELSGLAAEGALYGACPTYLPRREALIPVCRFQASFFVFSVYVDMTSSAVVHKTGRNSAGRWSPRASYLSSSLLPGSLSTLQTSSLRSFTMILARPVLHTSRTSHSHCSRPSTFCSSPPCS